MLYPLGCSVSVRRYVFASSPWIVNLPEDGVVISVTVFTSPVLATRYVNSVFSVSSLTLTNWIKLEPAAFFNVNFAFPSPFFSAPVPVNLNTGSLNVYVEVKEWAVSLPSPYFNHVSFLFPISPITAFSFNVAEYETIILSSAFNELQNSVVNSIWKVQMESVSPKLAV